MRTGILAGGNWVVDHVKILNTWPAQDSLANILRESTSNGGAPYNVLKDLARLGAPFPLSAVGLIGDDAFGQSILDDCRAHAIDVTQLHRTAEAATSCTDVMTVEATGRRTFFHRRGTNALLGPEHFDFARSTARHFHLGYLLLLDRLDAFLPDGLTGAAHVLRAARAAGLRTSLDCVSDSSDRFVSVAKPALPHVDYFFANDFEASRLTGVSLLDDAGRDPIALRIAARRLLDAGVREWVFVHSPYGVFASSAHEDVWQPSVRVPADQIKGAAGAGDALAAGILFGLHEDWPIARCLRLGVSAAAASLHDATCSASVRPVDECLKLVAEFGLNGYPCLTLRT
ncbi:MAG: carbohydrate kinase family protein [Opitutus sp.]|nr:carbohydrate kinase family protein [Opitutus sp.]